MEVSSKLHASTALPLNKEPSVPIGEEGGWAPEPVWTLWNKEKYLPLPEIELWQSNS
jgi:hypothetical protein